MDLALPGLVGAVIAIGVSILGRVGRFDQDRAFYPTVLIVIASYYILFAVMSASETALILESLMFSVFLVAAILGYRSSLWIVAGALVAHGVQDCFHGHLIHNPGIPRWWPVFCMAFDVVAGVWLGWMLKRPLTA